jgi:hypothetical protein
MRPFAFHHSVHGALHRYAHTPGEATVVTEANWPVLRSEWPAGQPTPMLRHAVDDNNTEEVAVYLGLPWRLTDGRSRHAIPCYFRDQAARLLGREPRFVAWEYDVEADEADPGRRENGFVSARASIPIRPRPTAFQLAHRHEAGLFHLTRHEDLVGLTRAALGDASAEVSVFAVADDRQDALVDALWAPEAPELSDLLGDGDLFVDLTLGVDLGYYDSLIVPSRDDITERLAHLAAEREAAIAAYEARVPRTTTVQALSAELDLLAGSP